jgi:hypothetical protein
MPLPNFILAGAPKSGTSSLWSYIRQHPDVFMPEDKELFYFDFNYDRGVDWYRKQFSGHTDEQAIGEATVWYMRWQSVPERMHEVLPDVKLIFVLRNPIDRARSNFWHDFRSGKYPFTMTFSEFIRSPIRDNRSIISSGRYFEHFQRFEQHFNRSQFIIFLTKDLKERPDDVLRDIYNFLGVDPSFLPNTQERLQKGWGFQYLDILRNADRLFYPIEQFAGDTPLRWLWRNSRHFRQVFWKKNARPPEMSEEDRAYLRDLYADSNARLSDYLGRDLSHWR